MELFKLMGKIMVDNDDAKRKMRDTVAESRTTGEKIGNAFNNVGKVMAAAVVTAGVAVAGFGVKGVREFAKFEKGMNEVFTLLPGISDKAMGQMNDDTRKFVREMGVAHDEAVPALYSAISAGIPQKNVFDFMEVAAKAAIGGVTDMETATDGLTSVMNAYGQENMSATEASDLMFTAVKNGKTNFEELSSSLYNVLPTASALGVDFGDITAAMASMTAQGTPTSVATTQLRGMMVELSRDGGKVAEAFEEVSGKSFKDFIAEGGNTQEALALLQEHAEDTGVGINDLFGSVEAGSAALALSGENADGYSKNIDDMANSAGATDEAFQKMEEGLERSWERMKINLTDAALGFGEQLAPAIQKVADWAGDVLPGALETLGVHLATVADWFGTVVDKAMEFVQWISSGSASSQIFLGVIAALAFAFGGYATVMGIVRGAIIAATIVQTIFNNVLRANPIGLIVTAILGLVAGLVYFFTQTEMGRQMWETFVGALRTAWEAFSGWFVENALPPLKAALDGLVEALRPIGEYITGTMVPAVVSGFQSFMEAIQPVLSFLQGVLMPVFSFVFALIVSLVKGAIQNVVNVFSGLITFFTGIINVIRGIFTGDFALIWEGLKQIVSGAVKAVWNLVQLWFLGRLISVVRSLGAGLLGLFRGMWSTIATTVRGAVTGIFNVIRNIFNNVRSFLSGIMNGIRSLMTSVWNGIRSAISSVVNAIRSVISSVFNAIRSTISNILNGIRSTTTSVWSSIRSAISSAVNAIRNVISSVFNAIRNTISSILNGVRSTVTSVFSAIRSFMGNAANAARNLVVNAFNALRSAVTNTISNVLSTVRALPGRIKSALGNVGRLLLDSGRKIIGGLVDGIKGSIGRVTGAVSSVMSAARDLLPFSPAKKGPFSGKGWTLYSGRSISESIGDGMEDKESDLISKVRGVVGHVKNELDTDLNASASLSMAASNDSSSFRNPVAKTTSQQSTKQDRMVELLEQILLKDSDLYLDGKTLVGATSGKMNNSLGDIAAKKRRGSQ